MCLGSIVRLADVWEDGGTRVGRLDDGCVVSLAFVPEARIGSHLLLHLGVPVEVLGADAAQQAIELRGSAAPDSKGAPT